jgi:hypothetical protein
LLHALLDELFLSKGCVISWGIKRGSTFHVLSHLFLLLSHQ